MSTSHDKFATPAHFAAQARCQHVIRCAVDKPTRLAVEADLANARRTGSNFVIYLAMLTGPCFQDVTDAADELSPQAQAELGKVA